MRKKWYTKWPNHFPRLSSYSGKHLIIEKWRVALSKLYVEFRNHFPRLLPYNGQYIRTCDDVPLPEYILPGDEHKIMTALSPQKCKFRPGLDEEGDSFWEIKIPYERKWRKLCEEDSNRITRIVDNENFTEPIITYVFLEKESSTLTTEPLPQLPFFQ